MSTSSDNSTLWVHFRFQQHIQRQLNTLGPFPLPATHPATTQHSGSISASSNTSSDNSTLWVHFRFQQHIHSATHPTGHGPPHWRSTV
ncbi:hypothetical protein E2P81_ATG07210 [Venturia nashicola]|uniref:Uncharacterized protein n=1 Tax=Venturia nashicola TaxID=86259 RepID=A0A4Z1P167_9PEZI|nr:hypothetical protein E6O75_ATG07373 [Venturia nashicola]TLD31720.1 hypothetical protein E2P81_ATG07210 [Venturia nashicola]